MVDYNNFAKTFSSSRKNMKWQEINYFFELLIGSKKLNILDIWCGNGRLYWELLKSNLKINSYIWIDLSKWLLNEAWEIYKWVNFKEINMLDINKITNKLDTIFFIASFHHLDNLEDRISVMKQTYNILDKWWQIFLTNWALNSELNKERYKNSIIKWSKNKYGSIDYNIKIWQYTRYYHCFSLEELEYIFNRAWFEILENKLFENKRNFISVLKKN